MAKEQKIVLDPTTLPGASPYHGQNHPTKPNKKDEDSPIIASHEVIHHDAAQTKEGVKEAVKESVKEGQKNQQKLEDLLDQAVIVLFRVRNIIPIFTAELVIDTSKVTVIHRPFFFSERIHSVSIHDISDIYIDTVPFMATVNIIDRDFIDNVTQIRWIWKSQAERARRIITGLMEAAKQEIDVTKLDEEQLAEKLEEIGRVHKAHTSVSKA